MVYTVLAVIVLAELSSQPGGMLYSLALIVIPVTAITNFGEVAEGCR